MIRKRLEVEIENLRKQLAEAGKRIDFLLGTFNGPLIPDDEYDDPEALRRRIVRLEDELRTARLSLESK